MGVCPSILGPSLPESILKVVRRSQTRESKSIMSGQLDEKDLNGIKQNVLVHLRQELVDNVDPRRYMTFLRSKYVLDERDCDVIKSTPSRHASAEKFFDLLAKKGSSGYDEFCNALLYDKTQVFLLTSMNTTLQILKAKTKNLKKAKGINSVPLYHGQDSSIKADNM